MSVAVAFHDEVRTTLIGVLFIAGHPHGRLVGRNSLLVGIGMVILSASLVGRAIPLGG